METRPKKDREKKDVPLGGIYVTPGAQAKLSHMDCVVALYKHSQGDWGDVCENDWAENDLSLREGFRVLSAYKSSRGLKFWIITEADRSATTILFPAEY